MLKILGFVAKGSFGPILKVKDKFTQKTYAVKVLPKAEVLEKGALQQTKEEVIIQRQHKHTFIHNLQDCWQTQRHLFISECTDGYVRYSSPVSCPFFQFVTSLLTPMDIKQLSFLHMCDYCSTGDLHTYWLLSDHFEEDDVRLFAAELGSAVGFLHNLGIIHRDIKMENILLSDQGHLRLADFGLSRHLGRGGKAFTICGTIQYMAPEVLGGGPYSHAADWWSLGITLFSLAAGKFPVAPEPDHCHMLKKVRESPYDVPETLSSALALLITELLCKDPTNRLRNLDRFKSQNFFYGTSFDPMLLQKSPVEVVLKLRDHPDRAAKAMRGLSPSQDFFLNFDSDQTLRSLTTTPTDLSPTLAHVDQNQVNAGAQIYRA
ncbi:putative serine/threonine-protein kinase SgK494 [Merluccius polli]|uniref:Serine/threonine-protein kinase SgK494 n=1 Tax=Merluccius polli TaxID=89951 RepID=A0AA47MU58_MERPO|nr:putative serine/threonine-protein kinase SgK494 [Merluccius polli]